MAYEVNQRFIELAKVINDDTRYRSDLECIREHPNYKEIIGMADSVPLLLRFVQQDEYCHICMLGLHDLAGVSPIPPEDRGYLRKMIAAWLSWGRENGHLAA